MTIAAGRRVACTRSVPVSFDAVVGLLGVDAGGVVGGAPSGGGPVRVTLRPGPSARISWPVDVHLGPLIDDDGSIGLPLWWEASRHASWFPTFDGGLEIVPTGGGTEIRLVGGYQTPFGPVGAYGDGLIGHRFALACLEQFLSEVTDRLTAWGATTTGDHSGRVIPSPTGYAGREPVVLQTKMMILKGRLALQETLGREPNPAELAEETGISTELINLYWDETGTGGVPTWLLDRWVDHIAADDHPGDPPAVVVVRALLRTALEVSDGYTDLIRFMARANAAPEAEMTRLTLLWTTWTQALVDVLHERGGVDRRDADTAAKRAIIVLWDAVTRWGINGHRGHYGPFLRQALLAQIPEAILVVDELTGSLPQWHMAPTDPPASPDRHSSLGFSSPSS